MSTNEIITRAEAREKNLPRYFTGVECINGHLSERMTRGKQCLACHREARARLRASDPERIKVQKAAYYARNRETVKAKVAAYTAANPEKVFQRRRAHRAANQERIAKRLAAWMKANRKLMRVHERRRRDRHRAAKLTGSHTLAEIEALFAAQNGLCANSLCRADLVATGHHEDHILALALGGIDDIANIQLLCPTCNLCKGALSPEEWEVRRHQLKCDPA